MTVVPILPGVAHSWAHSWREAAGLLQGGLRASGFTLPPRGPWRRPQDHKASE